MYIARIHLGMNLPYVYLYCHYSAQIFFFSLVDSSLFGFMPDGFTPCGFTLSRLHINKSESTVGQHLYGEDSCLGGCGLCTFSWVDVWLNIVKLTFSPCSFPMARQRTFIIYLLFFKSKNRYWLVPCSALWVPLLNVT